MNLIKKLQDRYRLDTAVREALDSLPAAVCYFTRGGAVKLCNSAMYALFYELAGEDLQSYDELKGAMGTCGGQRGVVRDGSVFLFPDGRAWQYAERAVTTQEGRTFTEAVFSEVTDLYEKRRALEQQSQELKTMYADLRRLSGRLLEVTRQQEILDMKMRLHDQMNLGISAIRQSIRQDVPPEEAADAARRFRRAVEVLEDAGGDPQEELDEFLRDAEVAGVQVSLCGSLPEEEAPLSLLTAVMREACVNAARHADASALTIAAEREGGAVRLTITNNGRPPEGEIVPRGGLKDLADRIGKAGGSMEIRSLPAFVLTVTLPAGGRIERRQTDDESTCGR